MKEMEVITTADKDQRDRLYEDLRRNGNRLERQVVKFSGVEPILDDKGEVEVVVKPNYVGRLEVVRHMIDAENWKVIRIHSRIRPIYRSTWSVAYPTSPLIASRHHRNEEKN